MQRVVAEPELRQHAGPVVVDHDIGAAHEILDHRTALVGREPHADRALPAVQRDEVQGLVALEVRTHRAGVVGMRRVLHLEHVGSEVGQHEPGVRPGQEVAELEDADAVEWRHRVYAAPGSLASTRVAGVSVPVPHLLEDLHREVTALGDVVLQHPLGLVRVVRFQRAQDPGVVPRRDLGPLRDELEVADGQAARQSSEHRREPTRTARLVDHLVELVVPLRLVLGIGRRRRTTRGSARSCTSCSSVSDVAARLPASPGDEPEDPVVVDDVGAFQPSHERAPPRHRVDEALLRELDERFPHRHAAHARAPR